MKTSTRPDAIIIGCGIAGPVVAMALQHVGIDATIYEAYDRPADYVGSFLNLASNGIDALRVIGADRGVLDAAFPTPRMVMWSGSGKRLGEVANGIPLADGTTSQTIQRGLLHRALRGEAVRRGIRIVQGKRVAAAEPTTGGVVAIFDDGTRVEAAMLVGADGLQSAVRRLIDPAAPSPRATGLFSVGARAVSGTLLPTPDTFHMIFGKRAFFGYTVRPSGEIYWFANVGTADRPERGQRAATAAMWKEHLRDLFADDEGPAREIVNATGEEIAAYPIFDMPAVPRWHAGPMVIIGDAAHATSPSSGQGASMAIEDAIVLAKCLGEKGEVRQAFAAYERFRRSRVERVVRYSARVGRTKSPGPFGRWFRDLCMPAALKIFASPKAHAWLYGYRIDWSTPVGTPSQAMRAHFRIL